MNTKIVTLRATKEHANLLKRIYRNNCPHAYKGIYVRKNPRSFSLLFLNSNDLAAIAKIPKQAVIPKIKFTRKAIASSRYYISKTEEGPPLEDFLTHHLSYLRKIGLTIWNENRKAGVL